MGLFRHTNLEYEQSKTIHLSSIRIYTAAMSLYSNAHGFQWVLQGLQGLSSLHIGPSAVTTLCLLEGAREAPLKIQI